MIIEEKIYITISSVGVYNQLVSIKNFNSNILLFEQETEYTKDYDIFCKWAEHNNIEFNRFPKEIIEKGVWIQYFYKEVN